MDREKLRRHKKNKARLATTDRILDKLREQLENVEVVSGKVSKSGDDFPYIEEHITVRIAKPKESTRLKERIREKEHYRERIVSEMAEVETWIESFPEGMEKQILEMVYLEGMSQTEVADMVGYSKGRISQIISKAIKD